jgi:hypothetical protein
MATSCYHLLQLPPPPAAAVARMTTAVAAKQQQQQAVVVVVAGQCGVGRALNLLLLLSTVMVVRLRMLGYMSVT